MSAGGGGGIVHCLRYLNFLGNRVGLHVSESSAHSSIAHSLKDFRQNRGFFKGIFNVSGNALFVLHGWMTSVWG